MPDVKTDWLSDWHLNAQEMMGKLSELYSR